MYTKISKDQKSTSENDVEGEGKEKGSFNPTMTFHRYRSRRRNLRATRICVSTCRFPLVGKTARKFGMIESSEFFSWNVYWTDVFPSLARCRSMKSFQKINHFPGMLDICRKDTLAENLQRMQKYFPKEYDFFPKTWYLPDSYYELVEFAKANQNKVLIVKPTRGSEGRGIFITKNLRQLKTKYKMIAQEYIMRPLLIDDYKFDFRLYVLITSCDPLRIYTYNEGLARFATKKYKCKRSTYRMQYMHLTNYAVNRRSSDFIIDDESGSKRMLSTINDWFEQHNYDVRALWASIDDVIIKTILVVLPKIKYYYNSTFVSHTETSACFEILGFDFILDENAKPYLLEVNYTPSFNRNTPVDRKVKDALLHDTFLLLNLAKNEKYRGDDDKKSFKDWNSERPKKGKSRREIANKARTEWEYQHLGNYRRIYPSKHMDKYKHLIKSKHNKFVPQENSLLITEADYELLSDVSEKPKEVEVRVPKPPRKNPFISEETKELKKDDESKRKLLIQSHSLLDKLYSNLKNEGRRRLEEEINLTRSGKWDYNGLYEPVYNKHQKELTKNVSVLLKKISECPGLTHPEKEKLSSIFLEPPLLTKNYDWQSHIGPIICDKANVNSANDLSQIVSTDRSSISEDECEDAEEDETGMDPNNEPVIVQFSLQNAQ